MSLPKYPAYKDSGVQWLGEVPAHWNVDRLKASIISCKNGVWGQDALQDENDIPCVRVADFDRQKLSVSLQEPTIRNVLQKDRNERVLTKNNLLLEKSGGGENQLVGCVVLYEDENPAVCSNFVAKITIAPNMSPSYWRYVHFAIYSVRLNYCSIKQTSGIQNLDQDSYFNEKAPFPSFQEQTLIAQFLDRETAKIDDLIAEQEKLITLLDEKRQAMISHAVTKGLNPDVPMRDSGVSWLGAMPKHWEVKPLKYMAKIGNGSTPHRDTLGYWENGHYPWLNSSVVNQDEISESDQFVTALALKECHLPIIKPPAILVGITGQGRTRGMAATLMFEATINQHVVYVKPNEAIVNIAFLRRFFDKSYSDLRTDSDWAGSTKGAITCEQIENLVISLPSLLEQAAIVTYLDKKTAQLDTLKAEAQRGIELLKERRSAFISAAVTGKIDVRHAMTEQVAT